MSIKVLLRDYPNRVIALVTPTHSLIFRHTPSTNESVNHGSLQAVGAERTRSSSDASSHPRCMVEFSELSSLDMSDFRTLSHLPVRGILGLITINNDVFLCVVTGATQVANVRPGETVEKIHGVEFYCLNTSQWDTSFLVDDIHGYEYGQNLQQRRDAMLEHPCMDLQKLLTDGSFYYSTDFDLTNRMQDRSAEAKEFDIENLDESFLWNAYMIKPLVKFRSQLVPREREALDASHILTSAIRGYVRTSPIPISSAPIKTVETGLPSTLTIISRLSCRRAGTRFNSRGIDDDGHVANFVESETIYWSPGGLCFSYVQVRGSVPVFWEQEPSFVPSQQKLTFTRSKEASQPAFDMHMEGLSQSYGVVHVVNLLSATKTAEAELSNLYKNGVRHSSLNAGTTNEDQHMLRETDFDFHAETKQGGYEAAIQITPLITHSSDGFAYYLSEDIEEPTSGRNPNEKSQKHSVVILQQEGVFRTNCLDCLDRTNLIQTIISRMALETMLTHRGEVARADFWMRHSILWADNGDALSVTYAGTGALKSSYTRSGKSSLAGTFADIRKSATRLVVNNFMDKGRQNTIDVLLGKLVGQIPVALYDPINDHVNIELSKHSPEFSSSKIIKIFVGTFNLNGRTDGTDADLSAWLCPDLDPSDQPEIVVVGFQEIVELSPQQIMNSDPNRRRLWERSVKTCLNTNARKVGGENYVMLRSGQLVGAALCIFVKASALRGIKNVEGSVVKTGVSGMAGNKGAVAIRMDYESTKICFVTAHLAAGFANYDERNRDFRTISERLRFLRNRTVDDHDTIIWLGDFNYRIGMSAERVKGLIQQENLEALYENDQLNIQMVAGLTFPHYSEAKITFMPTYKFDLGVDVYDTSEKSRIPAWTDRILRKGSNIRQTVYNSAPLKFSDHRPVYGLFQCTINVIDENIREALSRKFFQQFKSEVGGTVANSRFDDTDDEDLIGYDAIEPGLPPASSDRGKWWIEGGQAARSTMKPPTRDSMVNPDRPANPFGGSDETDWVKVPRNGALRSDPTPSVMSTSTPVHVQDLLSNNNRVVVGRRTLPPPPLRSSNTPGSSLEQPPVQPPRPRRDSASSTTSQTSSITRKPAPPVVKKPSHLASPPVSDTFLVSNSDFLSLSKLNLKPVARASTQGNLEAARNGIVQTGFPPPPRRATGVVDTSRTAGSPYSSGRSTPSQAPPPPQARRSGPSVLKQTETNGNTNGGPHPRLPPRPIDLLSDEADEMDGWAALKPSREV